MDSGRRVALLRAVNVGGAGKVPMADLRAMADSLGFTGVTTLLQSGNLVLTDPKRRAPEELEALLEAAARTRLGHGGDFMVRTADEWRPLVAANPFPAMVAGDPGHVHVVVLKGGPVDPTAVARLAAATVGPEEIAARGRELYVTYPQGAGRSKLTLAAIERGLATRGTMRNWNTVLKLAALLEA